MRRGAVPTFFEVVTDAVGDIQQHGFDSEDRVAEWVRRIRAAAERDLTPIEVLDAELKRILQLRFKRVVESGAVWKMHPEVSLFTRERVKPKLRRELDRRMAMSRGLIVRNRTVAIARTEQRFIGWASSIPAGGSEVVAKNPVKADIRKALAQLPFEERRVAIDQGMKLISSVSNIIATDGGAIAVIWNDHGETDPGYNARHEHMERAGKYFTIKGNWAQAAGLMKPGPAGYYEDVTAFGEEVFCFPGSTTIPFANGVEKAYRRLYEGTVLTLFTASGKVLTGTPNHPILTGEGWKPLGLINEGDDVIEISDHAFQGSGKDQNDLIPTIAQVFGSLEERGVSKAFDYGSADFHGDGAINGKVDIVSSAGPLLFDSMAPGTERVCDFLFAKSDHAPARLGYLKGGLIRVLRASNRIMSGARQILSGLGRQLCHSHAGSFGPSSWGLSRTDDVAFDQHSANPNLFGNGQDTGSIFKHLLNHAPVKIRFPVERFLTGAEIETAVSMTLPNSHGADPESICDFRDTLPFRTQFTRVIKINSELFSGHVYNLQTVNGWFVANGILSHNCRCFGTYIYSIRRLPPEMVTQKGRDELDRIAALRKAG